MSRFRSTSSLRRQAVVALVSVMSLAAVGGPTLTASAASAAPPAPTICPSPTPNGRFVRQIYLQILGRCPDGRAATYWVGRLNSNLSRAAFAEAIDVSNENTFKNNVVPSFLGILGRPPTAKESAFWGNDIRVRRGDHVIAATLGASNEAYAHIPGASKAAKDQAWLTGAYMGILDRNPDAAGRAYFTAQLGPNGSTQVTRRNVALHLEVSSENARDWVGAVYGAGFGRGPDAAGMRYWVSFLLGRGHFQTFQMWTLFLSSDEGYAVAQRQLNPGPEGSAQHLKQSEF